MASSLTIWPLLPLCWASDLVAKFRWVLSLLRLYISATKTRKLTSDINVRRGKSTPKSSICTDPRCWSANFYPSERKTRLDSTMVLVMCLWNKWRNLAFPWWENVEDFCLAPKADIPREVGQIHEDMSPIRPVWSNSWYEVDLKSPWSFAG